MPDQHRQCKLRCGNTVVVSWIPAKFAKVNNVITLDDKGGQWTVEEVWAIDDSKTVMEREMLFKKHRLGTDAQRNGDEWDMPRK